MFIDVHSHVVPRLFPVAPRGDVAKSWPCMHHTSPTTATISMGATPFRELDDRSWSVDRRIEDMQRDGVDVQVLSAMPELLSYWMDVGAARLICDYVNASISAMVAIAPDRFRGLGCVPMQDVGAAVAYLPRLRTEFGLIGFEIGSNINGTLAGDDRFAPVYEAAQDLGLAIFVHALHPVATSSVKTPGFTAFAGFPIDVAMAGASFLMSGMLERFPKLRVGLSHGGGALGAILGRLDIGWGATDRFGGMALQRPSEAAKRLFFDGNVYDGAYLRYLAEVVAPGRIFAGTDYPYTIRQTDPAAYVAASIQDPAQLASIRVGAAAQYLQQQF